MSNAKKLLRKLEWSGMAKGMGFGYMGSGNDGPEFPACPICDGIKPKSGADREFPKKPLGILSGVL